MRKCNVAGFVFFLIMIGFTIWTLKDNSGQTYFMPAFFTFVGAILCGVDRWVGHNKSAALLVSLLWTGYWGFVAFELFSIAGLYAFAVGFGHGGNDTRWIVRLLMYGYFCVAFLFGALALINLFKFFISLFLIPKLESH